GDRARLAVGERAFRLAAHRRLGAVAAEPAVVAAVGGDDRHVALLRRARRLAPHHHGQDERLAPAGQVRGELEDLCAHQAPPVRLDVPAASSTPATRSSIATSPSGVGPPKALEGYGPGPPPATPPGQLSLRSAGPALGA